MVQGIDYYHASGIVRVGFGVLPAYELRTQQPHRCAAIDRPTIADTYAITYPLGMTAIAATNARSQLYRLIDQVNADAEPITITGARGNAVLVGEDDWRAIQETIHLSSIPGMTQSIQTARSEGIEAGSEELDW